MRHIILLITLFLPLFSFSQEVSTFIYNGTPSSPSEWRQVVALSYKGQFVCSGLLYRRNIVLTAAHCLEGLKRKHKDLKVHTGTGENLIYEKNFSVKAVHYPRDYQGSDFNDYGYLVLKDFVISPEASVADVFSDSQVLETALTELHLNGGIIWQVGYGVNEDFTFGRKHSAPSQLNYADSDLVYTIGLDSGTCSGDSGSAAFIDYQGKQVAIGLLSSSNTDFSDFCGSRSNYVRIDKAVKFFWRNEMKQWRLKKVIKYLQSIRFGDGKVNSYAWRYRKMKGLKIEIDDSPFAQGYPYFYVTLTKHQPIRLQVTLNNIISDLREERDGEEDDDTIEHRVNITRLTTMPSHPEDQKLYRKIFNCHKEKNKNKCLRRFSGRLKIEDRFRTRYRLFDTHWWGADQLGLYWQK